MNLVHTLSISELGFYLINSLLLALIVLIDLFCFVLSIFPVQYLIRIVDIVFGVLRCPDLQNIVYYNEYVVATVDKAQSNIGFICKTYYIQFVLSEVDIEDNYSYKTDTRTTLSKQEILENHKSVLSYFNLSTTLSGDDLPPMYRKSQESLWTMIHSWICKIYHQTSFKTFTSTLAAVKEGLQSYQDFCYSRCGIK